MDLEAVSTPLKFDKWSVDKLTEDALAWCIPITASTARVRRDA